MKTLDKAQMKGHERGGIAIFVAFMMLVFVTLVAVGMSQNSLREAIIAGTSRQGSMARNVADSGIGWAVYWINPANTTGDIPSTSASSFAKPGEGLISGLLTDLTRSGKYYNLSGATYVSPAKADALHPVSIPSDLAVKVGTTDTSEPTVGFNLGTMYMGKYTPTDTTVTTDVSSQLDLWAIRSDGLLQYGTGTVFYHSKEAWITSPVRMAH